MKVFSLFIFCCIFAACASSSKVNYGKPESVALNFYKALASYDLASAKMMVTEETKPTIDLIQTMFDALSEEEKNTELDKQKDLVKLLKKATCEVNGDEAKCKVCCNAEGGTDEEPVTLKKVDKKWLVDLPKEDIMGDLEGLEEEEGE